MLAIRSAVVPGVELGLFRLGPVPAIRKALKADGWQMDEVDRYEINEALRRGGAIAQGYALRPADSVSGIT